MRDNTKKTGPRHVAASLGPSAAVLLIATAAILTYPAAAAAQKPAQAEKACAIAHATTGETGQPTAEISTDQMEVALAQIQGGVGPRRGPGDREERVPQCFLLRGIHG